VEHRVLILAPRGRDAAIALQLIEKNDLAGEICTDLAGLVAALSQGAGTVLITEEALAASDTSALTQWIERQPTWSDMPFVVLANGMSSPRSAHALQRLSALGNTVLLERPLHAEAMVGALRSALKARRRQYEVRGSAAALEQAVKERTADLERARRDLELALDAAAMGRWDIDLQTGTIQRTLRHDQILGYPRLQPTWSIQAFLEHVNPVDHPRLKAHFAGARVSGSLEFECLVNAANGTERWVAIKGQVQFDAAGQPIRVTGVISDITDRKEADAQLAQIHKMDAIGQLTGGVAHDFNNLLTPIVGSLDLLRRRHADDEKTQKLATAGLQAAERASTLTHRLLAFARRQALQPRAVDIGALVEGLVDLIRRSLGPSVEIVLDIAPGLPAARVDPNQLELALLNLAINARDAMPGGGTLTLSAGLSLVSEHDRLELEPGRYIRLTAADDGIGMDRPTLARAIEPFFSTKGVGKGTGLGLSMVHGLAAQSEGKLHIDSAPGAGTRITLWLPTTSEAVAEAAPDKQEPIAADGPAVIGLVDDEEIVRVATSDMLRELGYTVIEFVAAIDLLAAMRSGIEIDALVTDYLMPNMTGAQLIREMRAGGRDVPTLLVTGYAAAGEDVPDDIARLAKPFLQADIAARLHALLSPANAARSDA
jgi:signal transduction histidine kinase